MPDFHEDDEETTVPADLTPAAPKPHLDRDPRDRPADPAGTRPKVEADSVRPESDLPLLKASIEADVDAEGEEVPLDEGDLLPSRRPLGTPAVAAAATAPAPHANRFGFGFGALLAVAAAGVVLAVLVISNNGDSGPSGPRWSAWTPTKDGGSGPAQIAGHVGPQYRLATGRQMVLVTSSALKVQDVDLDIAKVAPGSSGDIKVIKGDKTVMYRMCGLSSQTCSIPGAPSASRLLLVKREALELALYTMRYTDANGVVVLLPPTFPAKKKGSTAAPTAAEIAAAQQVRYAAYFRRDDLKDELKAPVTATLSPTTPSVSAVAQSPNILKVDNLIAPSLYKFELSQGNTQNSGYMVLTKA